MVDNNQLGRNIHRLRDIHGETLEQLGGKIHLAKTTVKGYENGSRKPDLETLQRIAKHYNQTTDELLHSDLTSLQSVNRTTMTKDDVLTLFKSILPLQCDPKSLENQHFKKACNLINNILNKAFSSGLQSGIIFGDIFSEFDIAFTETGDLAAIANTVWTIFLFGSSIVDYDMGVKIQQKFIKSKINLAEISDLYLEAQDAISEEKQSFLDELDVEITACIALLKSDLEWSDLGDYYLALRYIFNMVNNDLTRGMNSTIGTEMIVELTKLGNTYAYSLLENGANI